MLKHCFWKTYKYSKDLNKYLEKSEISKSMDFDFINLKLIHNKSYHKQAEYGKYLQQI